VPWTLSGHGLSVRLFGRAISRIPARSGLALTRFTALATHSYLRQFRDTRLASQLLATRRCQRHKDRASGTDVTMATLTLIATAVAADYSKLTQ